MSDNEGGGGRKAPTEWRGRGRGWELIEVVRGKAVRGEGEGLGAD